MSLIWLCSIAVRLAVNYFIFKVSWRRLDFWKSDLLGSILVYLDQIKSWKWGILRIVWILSSELQWQVRAILRAYIVSCWTFPFLNHAFSEPYFLKLESLFVLLDGLRFWYLNSRLLLNEVLFENVILSCVCHKGKFAKRLTILLEFLWFYSCFLHVSCRLLMRMPNLIHFLSFEQRSLRHRPA